MTNNNNNNNDGKGEEAAKTNNNNSSRNTGEEKTKETIEGNEGQPKIPPFTPKTKNTYADMVTAAAQMQARISNNKDNNTANGNNIGEEKSEDIQEKHKEDKEEEEEKTVDGRTIETMDMAKGEEEQDGERMEVEQTPEEKVQTLLKALAKIMG